MSKPSRRPARELQKARLRAQKKLRQKQRAEGLEVSGQPTLPNRKSQLSTREEEQQQRQDTVVEHFKVLGDQLRRLIPRLAKIPDPRNPRKTKHVLTSVLVYGILSFVFQMASRREANRKMTLPMFQENLKLLVPELEDLPHHDTLYRLLARIDVEQIQQAHMDLVQALIRRKKFRRYRIGGFYPIAIDGTQKLFRTWRFDDHALERPVGSGEEASKQYYVVVVEACLAFRNGLVLPLLSEFLTLHEGASQSETQDCESQAFKRLAKRLKQHFRRLKILLLLDGLYPNGPIMALCRRYHWQFMIVLQNSSLPRVWEEFEGLKQLQPNNRRRLRWGNRHQSFVWVNEIEYTYGRHESRQLVIHMVVCEETWEEVAPSGEIVTHRSRHAWISSEPLSEHNLHSRCNLAARHRWAIETNILVEKRHGYHYEHCFAYNWNAMKGYHYLMRLGHFFNVLARCTERLQEVVRTLGVRGWIDFLRETVAGPWLDAQRVRAQLSRRFQIRLA
ncbi:MAG: transposase family protein [bacterium]|nr:transposase family protein [bacterium]